MSQSELIFNPQTGLQAPETEDIRAAVASDWIAAFYDPDLPPLDTEPTTPAGQLIDAETAEIEAKNASVLYLSNQFNPYISSGRWQDGIGYIYFIERKIAEPTIVECQLTGLNGTVIPYGALAASANGYTLICNRSVTIDETSTATTTFRVSQYGAIEIPPHNVNTIITVTSGWDTIDNASAGAVGRSVETRAEFEERRAASVAMNAHGSTGAIFGTIANLPGVLDVQVLENIGPDPITKYGVTVPGHGITVCVFGGDDEEIAEAIYRKKDNGADTGGNTDITYTAADYHNAIYTYLIMRPTTINFWVKVTLGDSDGYTSDVDARIRQAVYNAFYGLNEDSTQGRVGLATTVYASRFYCPVMSVDGVRSVATIEVALQQDQPAIDGYTDSIDINGDQEPVFALTNVVIISDDTTRR